MSKFDRLLKLEWITNTLRNDNFSKEQKEYIRKAFDEGLTIKQLECFANPWINLYEMKEIKDGFDKGLTVKQVLLYANKYCDWRKMRLLKKELIEGKLTEWQLKTLSGCAKDYSIWQMEEIIKGLKEDIPKDKVYDYIRPWNSETTMMKQRYKLTGKKKDADFKQSIIDANVRYLKTKEGMTRCAFDFLLMFLIFNIFGIYLTTTPNVVSSLLLLLKIFKVFNLVISGIFFIILFLQLLSTIRIILSHHQDTALRRFINTLISAILFILAGTYSPNVILAFSFEILIVAANLSIQKYLCDIKYYS